MRAPHILKPLVLAITPTVMLAAAFAPTAASAQSAPSDYTSATRYDDLGRTAGTIAPDPDGAGPLKYAATRTTYDARGNVIKVETGELDSWQDENQDPLTDWGASFDIFTTAETTYDAANRKLTDTVKGSDGVAIGLTQYSYDNVGRLECTATRMNPTAYGTLPASACTLGTEGSAGPDRITKTVYDDAGQVLHIRKAVGTSFEIADVTYSYTDNGKIEQVVDANGNRAELTYDGFDRQTKWIFPSKTGPSAFNKATHTTALATAGALNSADYEEYTYDKNGNRLTHRKRDGSVLSFAYDNLNRMTVKTVPTRAGLATTHTRDVYYSYDLRNLQTSIRFDSATGEGSLSAYDGFGRMTSVTDTMDGANRVLTSQHDANGNRTRLTHPDGQYWQLEFDGLNRADRMLENTSQIALMTYTERGQVKERQYPYAQFDTVSTPTYDPAGRTTALAHDLRATAGDVTYGYGYIPSGQLSHVSRDNDTYAWDGHVDVTRNYTTNGLNQYEAAGSASFCYDANGNLTADGGSVYLYDIENRLVEKRAQGTGNSNCAALSYAGALDAELRYDPLGRLYRVEKYISGTPQGHTRILYDGDAMVAEYNSSGTMLARYIHGTNADADDPLIWYKNGAVIASKRQFLLANHQGSIIAVTGYTGNLLHANTYDEYGINGSANDGRFQYTGQVWLDELGLYYYKARVYSPTLGRFMQTDPIGYEDAFNLYGYVGNDPINKVDFDGQREGFIGGIVDFAIGDIEAAIADPSVTNIVVAVASVTPAGKAVKAIKVAGKGIGKVVKAIKGPKKCCFVAGTLVDTENGLRAIEQIKVGDRVWARDEETGETVLKAVTDLIRNHDRVIWEVSLVGLHDEAETFQTTDNHPWWIAGQGWKKTEELTAGMAVVTRDGRGMVIASVVETERVDFTYNITVADFETYFVGEQRILVHNCKKSPRRQVTTRRPTRKRAKDARPRARPQKAKSDGGKRTTRQTKNQNGTGNRPEKHKDGRQRHFHDRDHNDKKKPNDHITFPD